MLMAVDITRHFEEMLGQPASAVELPAPVTQWCMVLVRPGYEQNCRDSLRRRGIGAWWPNYSKEIGSKDRQNGKRGVRRIMVPVLPGVILCPARLTENFWHALDAAPGAQNIARKFNTDLIMLTDLDIVLIHKIEQGLNRSEPPKSNHSYVVGDKVRMIDDELRRFGSGMVVECHKDGKLRVDIDIFGRTTPCILASWQVEPVDVDTKNQTRSHSTDARERPAKSPRRH